MQNEQGSTKTVLEEHLVACSWSSCQNCHWQLSGKDEHDDCYDEARNKENDVAWEKEELDGYTTKYEKIMGEKKQHWEERGNCK